MLSPSGNRSARDPGTWRFNWNFDGLARRQNTGHIPACLNRLRNYAQIVGMIRLSRRDRGAIWTDFVEFRRWDGLELCLRAESGRSHPTPAKSLGMRTKL